MQQADPEILMRPLRKSALLNIEGLTCSSSCLEKNLKCARFIKRLTLRCYLRMLFYGTQIQIFLYFEMLTAACVLLKPNLLFNSEAMTFGSLMLLECQSCFKYSMNTLKYKKCFSTLLCFSHHATNRRIFFINWILTVAESL